MRTPTNPSRRFLVVALLLTFIGACSRYDYDRARSLQMMQQLGIQPEGVKAHSRARFAVADWDSASAKFQEGVFALTDQEVFLFTGDLPGGSYTQRVRLRFADVSQIALCCQTLFGYRHNVQLQLFTASYSLVAVDLMSPSGSVETEKMMGEVFRQLRAGGVREVASPGYIIETPPWGLALVPIFGGS